MLWCRTRLRCRVWHCCPTPASSWWWPPDPRRCGCVRCLEKWSGPSPLLPIRTSLLSSSPPRRSSSMWWPKTACSTVSAPNRAKSSISSKCVPLCLCCVGQSRVRLVAHLSCRLACRAAPRTGGHRIGPPPASEHLSVAFAGLHYEVVAPLSFWLPRVLSPHVQCSFVLSFSPSLSPSLYLCNHLHTQRDNLLQEMSLAGWSQSSGQLRR